MHATQDGRSGYSTDGSVGIGLRVADPHLCKPVQVGSLGFRATVAAKIWANVLTGDPEDVWTVLVFLYTIL